MAASNKDVVEWFGSHVALELETVVPLAGAEGQFDEVGQELTAGYECQSHYQFFWDRWQEANISPHWTENG